MATASFRALRVELKRLGSELLPSEFDPLGDYDMATRTQTRAYLILCHAEFETYLEDQAKLVTKRAESVFSKTGKITRPLSFLLASSTVEFGSPQKEADCDIRMKLKVETVLRDHYKRIRDNHGVKEDNVRGLFDPIGVPEMAYGSTLLANLESFGSDRGDHAHHSSTALQNVIDPQTEFNRVEALLGELQELDTHVAKYLRKVR